MSSAVLDASAILAVLLHEPGRLLVASVLSDAAVSAANAAEVLTRLMEVLSPERARNDFEALGLRVVPFDLEQALVAAELRAPTKVAGLSLGDRACLALARSLRLPVLTADRNWARVDAGVDVRVIR